MSQTENAIRMRTARGLVAAAVTAIILIPFAGGFASRAVLGAQTIETRRGIEFISASASENTPQTQQILADLKALLNPKEINFPQSGNSTWDKWLNEDVAYLITPEERSSFLALKSDEQREQFVTQFWAKRNPNPGSAENAFKNEHYRRMAYANDHFSVPDAPGWQTDRGRTYILTGPPDEIDSHPRENREMWRYKLGDITIEWDISDRHKS